MLKSVIANRIQLLSVSKVFIYICKNLKFVMLAITLFFASCSWVNPQKDEEKKNIAHINTQLGISYLKQGDLVRAKQKLIKALRNDPQNIETNTAFGYFLEQAKEIELARYYYQKAITISKSSGYALNNYAVFLCKNGEHEESDKYFQKAVTDINYIDTAKAYENAGICALENKNFSKAKKYFIKSLEHNPKNTGALYELLALHAKEKNYEKALALLKAKEPLNNLLLTLAIDISHLAGEKILEQHYTNELKRFYGSNNNDYNSNFG